MSLILLQKNIGSNGMLQSLQMMVIMILTLTIVTVKDYTASSLMRESGFGLIPLMDLLLKDLRFVALASCFIQTGLPDLLWLVTTTITSIFRVLSEEKPLITPLKAGNSLEVLAIIVIQRPLILLR